MKMDNQQIANTFKRIATLLEFQNENPFRIRAYRNASWTLENLVTPLEEMFKKGEDLTNLPGIGKDLALKIKEIFHTGRSQLLEELEALTPSGLVELSNIPGLGPKKIKALHDHLGIRDLNDLEKAAREEKIVEVEGFAEKTQKHILDHLALLKQGPEQKSEKRFRWVDVKSVIATLVPYLEKTPGVKRVEVAGSYRRGKETIGDIDLLVTWTSARHQKKIIQAFVTFPPVREIRAQGDVKSTVILQSGLQIDLRLVPEKSFGAALLYFTGSKNHNVHLRRRAQERNLKINEYGVFTERAEGVEGGEKKLAGATEEEVYHSIGLPYIPPELREARGEIESALQGELPNLIQAGAIKGDLHSHTTAAKQRGAFLEINSQPDRLDLNDLYCKMAKDMGIKLVISSDAHSTRELQNISLGVTQARRGWLEKKDVVNTLPWDSLKNFL